MRSIKSSRAISSVVALAFVAALLAPSSARASKALFRIQRSFFGVFNPFTAPLEPPEAGSAKEPAATAYVFGAANRFVFPGCGTLTTTPKGAGACTGNPVVSYMDFYSCATMGDQCFYGYPASGGYYSYFNGLGQFAAGKSQGAPGPTMATTLVVPTTMGNNLPFGMDPPNTFPFSAKPVDPTSYFCDPGNCGTATWGSARGRHNFKRGGSIQVTPGPNKFSGTMRFLIGPKNTFYQRITVNKPYVSKGYGTFNPLLTTKNYTDPGDTDWTAGVSRFRLTSPGFLKKACIVGTSPCGAGNYYSAMAIYHHLVNPWTTGMIAGYQPNYKYLTKHTFTGYDNTAPAMTPAKKMYINATLMEGYPTRIVSLVRPRLTHTFLTDGVTGDIINNFSAMRVWKMDVFFLPEPGGIALLATGIAGLAGLAVLARRRRR